MKWKDRKRTEMKSSIKDQAEGLFHKVRGKARKFAGELTDNPNLEAEGTREEMAGKFQKKIGQVKKELGK